MKPDRSNEHRIGPEDVARFLNGDVTDLAEVERIAQAIQTDPQVGRWYEQLDLEHLLPEEEPDEAERASMAALRDSVALRARVLQRSVLWLLQPDAPLSEWLGRRQINGTVVGQVAGAERALPFSARPSVERPDSVVIAVDLPADHKVLGLVAGRLALETPRKQAVGEVTLQYVVPRPKDIAAGTTADTALQLNAGSVALRPKADAAHAPEESAVLSASEWREGPRSPTAKSRDLWWEYVEELEEHQRLRVRACPVAGRERAIVVAEMGCTDTDGRRATVCRTVSLATSRDRPRPGGWLEGHSRLPLPPDAAVARITVTVRSLTERDLHLLEPAGVSELLAEQDFTALPAAQAEGGLRFRLLESDRHLLADSAATCCLRVAVPQQEN